MDGKEQSESLSADCFFRLSTGPRGQIDGEICALGHGEGLDHPDGSGHDAAMIEDKPWFTGQFLLALPGMGDPRFEHAVIVMVSHDEEGAMGIGVGRPLPQMTVGEVLDQLSIPHVDKLDMPVYYGGPMEQTRGFVIHSLDWGGSDGVQISDRWMLSSSHDILRAIAEGRGPSRWLVSLGYAGWGAGQLEEEMVHHGWHVTEGSDALLFDTSPQRKWSRAYADSGIDPRLLTINGGQA